MGHPVTVPFPTFYEGFPKELMDTFTKETGYGYLGNEVASGTEIIERLGAEHIKRENLLYIPRQTLYFKLQHMRM